MAYDRLWYLLEEYRALAGSGNEHSRQRAE